jgi:hypothetical protein
LFNYQFCFKKSKQWSYSAHFFSLIFSLYYAQFELFKSSIE